MSFSVDLSHELHLKNVEDEARLQAKPEPQPEKQQEETQRQPKFYFFDAEESELLTKNVSSNDNENARQLISQLSSHTSGMTMENSEGSEEDLY